MVKGVNGAIIKYVSQSLCASSNVEFPPAWIREDVCANLFPWICLAVYEFCRFMRIHSYVKIELVKKVQSSCLLYLKTKQ